MSKSRKIIVALIAAIILLLPFLAILGIEVYDRIPRTVDSCAHGEYTAVLQALGSPTLTFGSQDGRFILKKGSKAVSKTEFTLSNDGKNMDSSNWEVNWCEDKVIITMIGEEQEDEEYICYYN